MDELGALGLAGLGEGALLLLGVLGEDGPDTVLKLRRVGAVDGEDGGEAELADDLMDRRLGVMGTGKLGQQHGNGPFLMVFQVPL